MKNFVDGGEAILEALRDLGIDYIMSSPGSEWGPVWEALARQKIADAPGPVYLSCAHETLAVDLAIGYTVMTGRLQAVMLHTGVGLLQGAMGIDGANRSGIPMVVLSGEALTYGDKKGFDPGGQWQANLSVVGSPHRLAEPLVKWSAQASSTETLFQQLVSAGELAQRTPTGPTYLGVPIETQLNEWSPPEKIRIAPPAPKPHPALADIEKVATLLMDSANPVIVTEAAGREPEGYAALIALAELLSIPVLDGAQPTHANFPKDHELYQGAGRPAFLNDADVILTVRCRAPWYPPSSRPAKATIVAIDETPFRLHMAHHASQADMFLEGDAVASLRLLAEAIGKPDPERTRDRKARWAAEHTKMWDANRAAEADVAQNKPIHLLALAAALGHAMPDNAFYVDETITYRGALVRHLQNRGPQSYYRPAGGLGQGLGVGLGVKLAAPERPVVVIVGDGAFMYNPVLQALALASEENLPILIVIPNNNGYQAMKKEHHAFYPDGAAAANDLFYGEPVTGLEYSEIPKLFGGFGRRVEDPTELPEALNQALAAMEDGKSAILNVMVDP